jgi:hypothetical protein
MSNEIILPPNTSTDTFDVQPACVCAVPSKNAEEPLLDNEVKVTVS